MIHLTWALAAVSLLATFLNARRRRVCFVLWLGTNAAWAAIDLAHGLPAQAALHAAYFVLAIYGLWSWRPRP